MAAAVQVQSANVHCLTLAVLKLMFETAYVNLSRVIVSRACA